MSKKLTTVREQHRDAIIHRLYRRCQQIVREHGRRHGGVWQHPEGDASPLVHLEMELDRRAKRIYNRLTDRHPERIGL